MVLTIYTKMCEENIESEMYVSIYMKHDKNKLKKMWWFMCTPFIGVFCILSHESMECNIIQYFLFLFLLE